jgi:hypothetical protein
MRAHLLLFACLTLLPAAARAEIALAPLRQVITPEAPVAVYEISNPSRRIVDGHVAWLDLTATEIGYRSAEPSERAARSAAPYLTVWPASFRLEPGARTTITVRLRAGATPPAGERRSHLLIETAAARTPLRRTSGALEVDIDIGVTTPVLLRSGSAPAAARLGDTRLLRTADGLLELETHVHPESEISAYGRMEVWMASAAARGRVEGRSERRAADSGAAPLRRIAVAENIAAYPEALRRRVVIPLGVASLPGGLMELRYVGAAEFSGVTFAIRRFEIEPARAPAGLGPQRKPEGSARDSLSPANPATAQ